MDEETMAAVVARFAPRLRELRDRAKLSQTDLARRSGVPQATVAAYEVGRHSPTWGAAVRLANALGVSLDSFLAAPEKKQEAT